MLRVLLVEDEPGAARYIRSIISRGCPRYTVVGTAENGAEGLRLALDLHPDLIVTDVRMPVMDGIEMVQRLNDEGTNITSIVLSGHDEFEYARRALHTGVRDYLLKPVSASRLRDALNRLAPVLEGERERSLGRRLLAAVRSGDAGEEGEPDASVRYRVALRRKGGLPRPSAASVSNDVCRDGSGLWSLPGRDAHERILIGEAEEYTAAAFLKLHSGDEGAAESGFTTTMISTGVHTMSELAATAQRVAHLLDQSVVLGSTQVLTRPPATRRAGDFGRTVVDRVIFALTNRGEDELAPVVAELASDWQTRSVPMRAMESALRKLVYAIRLEGAFVSAVKEDDADLLVENAVRGAADYSDLERRIVRVLRELAGWHADEVGDVPAFFLAVLSYLDAHYAEALSLQGVCERFRMSQTYVSRLFRRHQDRTFNEYLTQRRIEAARSLLAGTPDMPIKQVAGFCGFDDQYYFSRVFKAATGVSPSEYRSSTP